MKALLFLFMFCVSMTTFAQGKSYDNEADKKAVQSAFSILKLYYPAEDELCMSDSIYDLDWSFFQSRVDEKTQIKLIHLSYLNLMNGYKFHSPIYSGYLSSLFGSEKCICAKSKYVADFTGPYYNMIMCEILPTDRRIGMLGAPQISMFLFKYDDNGEIYQFTKIDPHIE